MRRGYSKHTSVRTSLRLLLLLTLCSCTPGIGSNCVQSTDCSPTGQLLCDTSQPNGYCTVFNCQPSLCPQGSGCIATNIAPLGCPYDDRHAPSRFSRQLCLKLCNQDSDCREGDGYACIDPTTYGLLVLDPVPEKVCLPATSYVAQGVSSAVAPVCSVAGPPVTPFDAGPGYEGDAGTDAEADAGADTGAEAGADAGADASDAAID